MLVDLIKFDLITPPGYCCYRIWLNPFILQILGRNSRSLHSLENVPDDRDDDPLDLVDVRRRLPRPPLWLERSGLRAPGQRQERMHGNFDHYPTQSAKDCCPYNLERVWIWAGHTCLLMCRPFFTQLKAYFHIWALFF